MEKRWRKKTYNEYEELFNLKWVYCIRGSEFIVSFILYYRFVKVLLIHLTKYHFHCRGAVIFVEQEIFFNI